MMNCLAADAPFPWLHDFQQSRLPAAVSLHKSCVVTFRCCRPQDPPPHHVLSPGMLQSIGIFALSMAGHSALPSFRSRCAYLSHPPLSSHILCVPNIGDAKAVTCPVAFEEAAANVIDGS